MSGKTISSSGTKGRPKMYSRQFSVALHPLERMFLEYYAERYGKDQVAILRGMLRRYVEGDRNFDPEEFLGWAERQVASRGTSHEERALLRQHLREYQAQTAAA